MGTKTKTVFFILGLVVFILLLTEFGIDNIVLNLEKTGWWFVPVIAVWGFVYVINAFAWCFIIDGKGHRLSFSSIFQITISGFAINYITPFVGLGGEPYRVIALKDKIGLNNSIASVLLYTMLHFFSHFIFWICAIISVAVTLTLTSNLKITLGLLFVVLVGLCYFMVHRHKNGILQFFLKSFSKIPGVSALIEKIPGKNTNIEEIDRQISDFYLKRRPAFFSALSLDLLARVVAVLEFYFILHAIGIEISLLESFYISAGSSLIMNFFFFVPFELGAKEGGLYVTMDLLKFTPAVGVYVAVINRMREFFWIFIGLVLIQLTKKSPSKTVSDKM